MSVYFEIGATVFGLTQSVLVMLNKRSNWIFYSLQTAFLLAFSLTEHLYGDIANSCVYLTLGVIGFIRWGKTDEQKISDCNTQERVAYASVILVGTLLLFRFLSKTNDPLPFLDAFTTVSSFVATYYMLIKKTDAWIIWFLNDIAYIVEYWLLPNQAVYLLLLNAVWTVMAVFSFIHWNNLKKNQ